MYIVEYLAIVDANTAVKCTNTQTLKNLIQSDIDFAIQKKMIIYKGYSFEYEIVSGQVATGDKNTFFHLRFYAKEENEIPKFTEALKSIRTVLSIVTKSPFVLWDDVTLYFSEKAYPKIFRVENLMRKLLSQFMLVNLGIGWTKDRIPTDVEKSANSNNKDLNFLHNIDFIQLSNFLFSENYPTHKDSVLRKLKQAKDLTNLNLEEIKSLLPETNWEKYFEDIVECEGEYLKKRWERLYDLRCQVAHNKSFTKLDLQQVEELTEEIGGFLESAITNLYNIIVPEDEKENVAENVAFNRSEDFGSFIIYWREFENVVQRLFKQLNPVEGERYRAMYKKFELFVQNEIITEQDYIELKELFRFRNVVVHGVELEVSNVELKSQVQRIAYYTGLLKKQILDTEQEHLEKIVNPIIKEIYETIKYEILKMGDIKIKSNKFYIAFVGKSNIVDIQIQQKAIKIWLNLHIGELNDAENRARDVSKTGHLGNGAYEIQIKPGQDLEYIMGLIKQSYAKNKK